MNKIAVVLAGIILGIIYGIYGEPLHAESFTIGYIAGAACGIVGTILFAFWRGRTQ